MRLRTAMLMFALLGGPSLAQENDLGRAIEHARHLSVTEAVPASQPPIDALMRRLDEATPRQGVEIRLLHIRNLALQGHYNEAIDRLRNLLKSDLPEDLRLHALRLAANLAFNVGHYEWGFTQLAEALALVPDTQELREKSRIFSLAGFVHSLIGNHGRAVEYAIEAVDAAHQSGEISELCPARQGLAVAYRYANHLRQAETVARQALENCREADNQVFLGSVELELARVALEHGELDTAQEWNEAGLERLRRAGWADGVITGEHIEARLAAASGEHRRAIELAEQLIERVDERELWERKAELHRLAAAQHAELDSFVDAYRHMVAHNEARERFLDQDRARRLAVLEVEFDVQRREQELELLREQGRVAELEDQTRRQQQRNRWLVTGFVTFLFIILILLLLHVLRERRHFRRLSQLDGLTRVSNHTRFFDTARMLVEESHRSGNQLVLALGDIDHFKQVNDEYGHITGDRVLRKVAHVLCENFPGLGHVGRIGGEEFAVCLPDTALEQVVGQLDQVRSDLAAIDYGSNGKALTMSFGVAKLLPDEALEQLRRRADDALYQAKRGGRNSVVVAGAADSD